MVWEPDHPNKSFRGWQYEHRLVAESVVGRHLRSDEQVHHVNGMKDDNRPENLEVLSQRAHAKISGVEFRDRILRDRAELDAYRRLYGPLPDAPDE
jgi:hypothetical protein